MLARRGVKVDKVLNFAIDDAILQERLTCRWIHPSSGRSYHSKFASPKVPGKDDVTGEPLIQCKDDTTVVLKSRLEAFLNKLSRLLITTARRISLQIFMQKNHHKKLQSRSERCSLETRYQFSVGSRIKSLQI